MHGYEMELTEFLDPGQPVLRIASTDVPFCKKEEKIGKVLEQLLSDGRSFLPVMDGNAFHGVITSRDVLDFLGAGPKRKLFKSLNVSVKRVLTGEIPALDRENTVRTALEQFRRHRTEVFPIVHKSQMLGLVSERDFIRPINKKLGEPVRKIMSRPVIAKEDWSVFDVAKLLCRGAFRRLPVTRKGVLLGVVTADDVLSYLNQVKSLQRLPREKTPIGKVVKTESETVGPEADVYEAVQKIRRSRTGLLPVTEDGELVGVVTERDILELFRCEYGDRD